ncbi:cyclin-K-like [Limulus polyphemus]|uniref:Cyclin-K-like n=1 Tax=Limulus polyphemus TaxID=6850 RepID=A0ABM1BQG7_LIMPO|nr:cyclin-K-like [Limulus polyphemus]XP_022255028.1 cyclin-K-like [Limulus polyphemus]XP_022255029.1 cyclin-K-like [Limulus polyphemus]
MPSWYYDKKDLRNTPSVLDGISIETEQWYRKEGARFIINMGIKMGLRYDTIATGVMYFHRFYMIHSFKTFPKYVTACSCLFLAGKVEETPKKCKDIIKMAQSFLTEQQVLQFGEDSKEEVMTLERILLQTMKFDLQVDHPYRHLLKYAKSLKGDKQKLQKMVQMAWTFINDSLCTTICLQWEPEIIAIALIFLAGKLSKFEVLDWSGRTSKHQHWWEVFVEDLTIDVLEDICHQVLDLYSTPTPSIPENSFPSTSPLKSDKQLQPLTSPPQLSLSPPQQPTSKESPLGQSIPKVEKNELKDFNLHEDSTMSTIPLIVAATASISTIQTAQDSPYKDEPVTPITTTGSNVNISSQQQEPVISSEMTARARTVPNGGCSDQSAPTSHCSYPTSISPLAPCNTPFPLTTNQYYHHPEIKSHPQLQCYRFPTLPSNQTPYNFQHPTLHTRPFLRPHNPPPRFADHYSSQPQCPPSTQYSVPPLPTIPSQYPPFSSNPHQVMSRPPQPPLQTGRPPTGFGGYQPSVVTNLQQPPPQPPSTGIPQVRITGRF